MKKFNILIITMILAIFVVANDSRAAPQILGGGDGSGDATTLHDISIVEPTALDDGKYLQYEHDTPAQQYQWGEPSGSGDMNASVWAEGAVPNSAIDVDAGGTNADSSAWTGIVQTSTGTWSASNTIAATISLDDGATDSPALKWIDETNEEFSILKADTGHAIFLQNTAARGFVFQAGNDTSDYLTITTTSNVVTIDVVNSGANAFILANPGGPLYFAPSGDDDDRIVFATATDVPQITTEGGANLNINSAGGSISFGDENLSTTGTLGAGASTLGATSVTGNFLQKYDAAAYLTISTADAGATTLGQTSDGATDQIIIGDGVDDRVDIASDSWTVTDGVIAGVTNLTMSGVLTTGSGSIQITDATGNVDGTKVADADLGDIDTSSGSWTVSDLTIASEAQGDVLYRNASGWVRLAAGVSGQYLKTQGGGANPIWDDPSGSGTITAVGNVTSGVSFTGGVSDGNTGNTLYFEGATVNDYEVILTADNATSDVTITLPIETGNVILSASDFTTDNALIKVDASSSKYASIQEETSITIDDSANISGVGNLTFGASKVISGTTAITLGGGSETVAISSGDWAIGATGIATNMGDITSDGVVTATGFTIGSAVITETELEILDDATLSTTQINYLNAATGTTGTTSTNLVFSASPTLTGTAIVTNIDGSGTISANLFTPDAAGGADIGSDTLEFADIYLSDGAIIKGQADQSNTITSSANGWDFALGVGIADDKYITFGGNLAGYDWSLGYDQTGAQDSLQLSTTATAGTATDTAMVTIAADTGNSGMTADQEIFEIGKGGGNDGDANFTELFSVDEDGDIWIAGTMTFAGGVDSFLDMSNNAGGLVAGSNYIYFETDGYEAFKYSLSDSTEHFVINDDDAQTISGVKTFTTGRQIFQANLDLGDASNAGNIRIYDGSSNYVQLQVEALSGNYTINLPVDYGSANQALLSDGDGTTSWGNPSAAPAGSDTQVQFNDASSTGADAGFTFNKTTDTVTLGENSVTGVLALYTEIGGTDYTASLQGNASMSANSTITMPAATGTLATLGNAETFSGAKTFSADITLSQASPDIIFIDSTTSGEAKIAISDGAGPDGVMDLQVDLAGSLTSFIQLDGVNETIDVSYPINSSSTITATAFITGATDNPNIHLSESDYPTAADWWIGSDDTGDTLEMRVNSAVGNSVALEIEEDMSGISIGDVDNDKDVSITFQDDTAVGVITWMEDEDYFQFADAVVMDLTLDVTGVITGLVNTSTDVGSVTNFNGTFAISSGSSYAFTLPSASGGHQICLYQGQSRTDALSVTAASGDYIVVDGVRGTVEAGGGESEYHSTGAAGDRICLVDVGTDDWYVSSIAGSWSE